MVNVGGVSVNMWLEYIKFALFLCNLLIRSLTILCVPCGFHDGDQKLNASHFHRFYSEL